jgi:Ca2+-binding RTX toxin-like protein
MLVTNAASGMTFELIGTGFTYSGGVPTAGTINEIHILDANPGDFTDLATIHDHTLVDSDGGASRASSLFGAVGAYASSDPGTHASGLASLNTIFNSARYSVAGASGFVTTDTEGHSGNDVLFGGNQADTFIGLSGSDTVDYSHATGPVTANLATSINFGSAAAGDLFNSIENLRGTDYTDTLTGDGSNNVLEGGPSADALVGGGGIDTASYEHAAVAVHVDLATPGNNTGEAASDSYNSIENILGSSHNDILVGDINNNTIEGGLGDDSIVGGGGNNSVSYEHATAGVVVDLSRSDAQDTVSAGVDTLSQIQNLFGSHHNDILAGDSGDNLLIGMGGSETFVFNTQAVGGIGHDTVGDFSPGEDHILLDYAAFDASGPNDFSHWIASHATSQSSGQDTLIDFDPLGDPGQQTILLKNVAIANLHASDFILPAGGGA